MLHQSPQAYGLLRQRWRLQDLGQGISWLQGYSEAGVWRVLKHLGLASKQALNYVRSPDTEFRPKWQAVLRAYAAALVAPEQVLCLFMDELTYYRQPSLAPAYHPQGQRQPYAHQVARFNTQTRLVAALNACTGQVTYQQRSKIGKEALPPFLPNCEPLILRRSAFTWSRTTGPFISCRK